MSALLNQLELLAGQRSTLAEVFDKFIDIDAFEQSPIGVSQVNELLLTAGFDRISEDFFMFLYTGRPAKYEDGTTIRGMIELETRVNRLRIYGALKFGNFKFAFKRWSQMSHEQIEEDLLELLPPRKDYFTSRTKPLEALEEIPLEDRWLLGYVSGKADGEKSERLNRAKEVGKENLRKYLTSDHMDVYIATSMRKYRDYISVGTFIRKIFDHPKIEALKIRHFDPTQVYSPDRFCKGLVESLMLKRAKCCIYCVQEMDTLGKDSELATMLAQGKPVIAWVPEVNDVDSYADRLIGDSKREDSERSLQLLKNHLATVFPDTVLADLALLTSDSERVIARRIAELSKKRFEERAHLLLESHPLAMQVDLKTGVAHGVIVVRREEQCVEILHGVLHRELEFELEELEPSELEFACGDYTKTYILKEKTTGSPYRVVIGDEQLTNSFWNFYLRADKGSSAWE
jgi:hypothetical protein